MTQSWGVASEIGRLRTVLVHRPGSAIARLTPENKAALLFDDLLWVERAQEEHDAFVAMMRDRDVAVHYFTDLLGEVLAGEEARRQLLAEVFSPTQCGPRAAERLTEALHDAPVDVLVDVLIGGMLETELAQWGVDHLFADLVADRFHYVLRPLPNLLFMRDNAAWINEGLCLNALATPARERESLYMRAIYSHHPLFSGADFPFWYGVEPTDRYPAAIEGGDTLVLAPDTVMIGLGERTSAAAMEMLAGRLFAAGTVQRVIVVHLRHDRAVMHLDTVFTQVDVGKFNVFPGLEEAHVHVLTAAGDGGIRVARSPGLEAALGDSLGLDRVELIPTGGDAIGRLREQWDDGNNTLALAPGLVVAYTRNRETNRRLTEAGVEVLELDSSELCRGRGGSRCMTQPLLRDPV